MTVLPPIRRSSCHVAMPDGVRLAVDIWRSAGLADDHAQPTLLLSTRYWRAFDLAAGDLSLQPLHALASRSAVRGMAVVNVDSRGSGASFGTRRTEWSDEERDDLATVMDWIVAQPWSDGRIAAHGYSYGGNTAFLAAATGHPALSVILPQFADFDIYRHNLLPGGVPNIWLNDNWARLTAAQDHGDVHALADAMPGIDRAAFLHHVRGPAPVDGPDGPALLAQAIGEHAGNFNIAATAHDVVCMDDAARLNAGRDVDAVLDADRFSIFCHKQAIEAAATPIVYWAGWFDAGTAEGAIELFRSVSNPMHVVIGAWSHGQRWQQDPFGGDGEPRLIPLDENFEDILDAAATPPSGKRLDYYVLGCNVWRSTDVWPPSGVAPLRFHFSEQGLVRTPMTADARQWRADADASTGVRNRWWTQINCMPVDHADRRSDDRRLLVHDTAPLAEALEIIGAPLVHLRLSCDSPDAAVFVYLEMIAPDGRVSLLTEAMLRLLHRRTMPPGASRFEMEPARSYSRADAAPVIPGEAMAIEIRMLPIAIRIPAGFRVRAGIAGADADTFGPVGNPAPQFTIHRGGDDGSWIDLPFLAAM